MRARASIVLLVVVGCGEASLPGPAPAVPAAPTSVNASPAAAPPLASTAPPPGPEAIFDALRSDLTACYEQGRKAIPAMTNGKVTFHASIDEGGKVACVIPADDTGLSQSVEDCMGDRLARERYRAAEPWSYELTIAVRDGAMTRAAPPPTGPAIDTIDTHGVDAPMSMVQGLLRSLDDCVQDMPESDKLRVIYVGGRVGRDGRVECALATSAEALPAPVRACAAGVLMKAKFSPPKSGSGLISIPVKVMGRKRR
ncbi:MAG: hypothetical protein KF819_12150 [Labilithrix sp.]|nr:hypothetical protein [Labilithrix sp.]